MSPGGPVSYEDQRRRYEQQRADRELVDQAAAQLRRRAIQDAYAGLQRKDLAFGLAAVLDELARNYREADERVLAVTLDCCRTLLRTDKPTSDRGVTS